MPDPLDEKFTRENPIVAAANRIRDQRRIAQAADQSTGEGIAYDDAQSAFDAFGLLLAAGSKRLNAILGSAGVKFIRIQKPPRLVLRFGEKRASLDLDEVHQLVRVRGLGLDGEWQFQPEAPVPSLVNLSKISTEEGYGTALTPSSLLQSIAQDAELPRPQHLDASGPLNF